MVLWQPRWVHAEVDALCYQKITADERPIGREKRIEFKDLKEIEELEYREMGRGSAESPAKTGTHTRPN